MNSSKKIVNEQKKEAEKKEVSVPEKKLGKGKGTGFGTNMKPIILSAICVVVILVLCVGVGIQQMKPKVVLTVDKTKVTMNDMMYPIYEVESQYAQTNEMYQAYIGTSFWESVYQGSQAAADQGITNSTGMKNEIMYSETQYIILADLAEKNGYSLTEDEKAEAEKEAEDALKGLSFMQKLRLDFSKKKLTKMFEKRALANKYREAKQEELNKDIDEADTIKDIKKEDYRQYDIQYYYASLNETNEDGETVSVGNDKKKVLQEKIEGIASKAKESEDFTKLAEEDDTDVVFQADGNFVENQGWNFLSEDNLKKVKKMKNNQVSEAFLDEEAGYYVVVKMINNNSEEAYNNACDSAIASAQEEAFDAWYTEEEKNHKVKINTDNWFEVEIGGVTTGIVTVEDLAAMQEDATSESTGGSAE